MVDRTACRTPSRTICAACKSHADHSPSQRDAVPTRSSARYSPRTACPCTCRCHRYRTHAPFTSIPPRTQVPDFPAIPHDLNALQTPALPDPQSPLRDPHPHPSSRCPAARPYAASRRHHTSCQSFVTLSTVCLPRHLPSSSWQSLVQYKTTAPATGAAGWPRRRGTDLADPHSHHTRPVIRPHHKLHSQCRRGKHSHLRSGIRLARTDPGRTLGKACSTSQYILGMGRNRQPGNTGNG
eukprot:459623-Hanusia_phi.AAC.2